MKKKYFSTKVTTAQVFEKTKMFSEVFFPTLKLLDFSLVAKYANTLVQIVPKDYNYALKIDEESIAPN